MAKINNSRVIEFIAGRTTVYMPIVEAVVNAIDAIEERTTDNGEITVELIRNPQLVTTEEDEIAPVTAIRVIDNGIGFTKENRNSFDTLFSEQKIKAGGKGFGRLTYLKYFKSTNINSTYQQGSKWEKRTFSLVDGTEFINKENVSTSDKKEFKTVLELSNIRPVHKNRLNKKLDTIARRLFELLLPYFVSDGYNPPKITVVDEGESDKVILNNYLKDQDKISLIYNEALKIDGINEASFKVKIFKIYHSKNVSSIALTAHHRQVTTSALYKYVPEFTDDFSDSRVDKEGNQFGNYVIKAYVIGEYLDKNVSIERGAFLFPDEDETLMYPISRQHIEAEVAELVRSKFRKELTPRRDKKVERIKSYVDENAPWNKFLLKDIDYDTIPFNADNKQIDTVLNKIAFDKELEVKLGVEKVLESSNADEINKKVDEITQEITDLGRGRLAHYVALRKAILDIFAKSLKLKSTNKFELENIVHKIIFPLRNDTDSIDYTSHNLWLLDERLSFNEYVASDKPLNIGDERPDLLSFDRPIAVREGDELSNPITIFEFKRPGRSDYTDAENPLTQVTKYVEKIRAGNYNNPQGRPIRANENTPAYCFIVCDITKRVKEFCTLYQLTLSPDGDAFYGFHSQYRIYFEVISFDKVLRDSKQRNKIFFKNLGID